MSRTARLLVVALLAVPAFACDSDCSRAARRVDDAAHVLRLAEAEARRRGPNETMVHAERIVAAQTNLREARQGLARCLDNRR